MSGKLYDITRTLTPATAVWPGDQPFRPTWTGRIEAGSSVNIGAITLSTHAGTHADAPLHFEPEGASIDTVPLTHFIGEAVVVAVEDTKIITTEHIRTVDLAVTKRLLFKTRSSAVPDDRWAPDFTWFDPALIDHLGGHGVLLIGTDAPSVDPVDSTTLPAHHALARHGIVNLENLMLRDVPPGRYRLVALPMKLHGLDAAPVRAVLMDAA